MRRILVDRARRRQARKHGGQLERVDLDTVGPAAPVDDDWLLQVHDALERLAAEDAAKAQIVKLRFFVGLNNAEVRRCSGYPRRPSSATGLLPKCGWHRPSNKSIRRCPFQETLFRVTSSRL